MKQRQFDFSAVVLWVLDAIFVLLSIVLGLGPLIAFLTGNLDVSFTFDGELLKTTLWHQLIALLAMAVISTICWSLHLVLASARKNKPFVKRNVYVLNIVGLLIFCAGVTATGFGYEYTTAAGRLTSFQFFLTDPPADLAGWFSNGMFVGLIILAVAAVFNKGVDLRREEIRLREEQALTI